MSISYDSLLCRELDEDWDGEVTSSNVFKDEAEVEVEGSNLPEDKAETSKIIELPDFIVEDEEMISLFVQKETDYLPRADYIERYRKQDAFATARRDAISWMHQVQEDNDCRPLTAYLSVNYLDRFLSTYHSSRQLPLLHVACVSLAVKMEEDFPPLTDLQVGGAESGSEAGSLYSMEFQILTALDWKLRSITPFIFIHYLLYRLKGTIAVPQDLISPTTAFIMSTTRAIDFLVHQPSSIAAAAVMCACEKILQTDSAECKEIILSSKAFNKEKIISCYNLLQSLAMDDRSGTDEISSGSPHSPVEEQEAAVSISGETSENTNSSKKRICETSCRAADQEW